MTEQKFEQSVEKFASGLWQYELLVNSIIAIILFIVCAVLIKKKKITAGWICFGIGFCVIIPSLIRLVL